MSGRERKQSMRTSVCTVTCISLPTVVTAESGDKAVPRGNKEGSIILRHSVSSAFLWAMYYIISVIRTSSTNNINKFSGEIEQDGFAECLGLPCTAIPESYKYYSPF